MATVPYTPPAVGRSGAFADADERAAERSRARVALALIVAISSVFYTLLALSRATPGYFPDEYIYAELGRSIAEGSWPRVRGGSSFWQVLHPLLTAPAWLFDEVGTSYRVVQAIQATFMSLAAVPAFLLARRLGLATGMSLACAGLTVAAPALLYSSWTISEPMAYTLSLAAVAAGVAALDRPTKTAQAMFLLLAALAVLTRMQLAAIPLCCLLAATLVGLRERRLRAYARARWPLVGVLATCGAVGAAAGLLGSLGYYGSLTSTSVEPLGVLKSVGVNAYVLAYGAGWIVVPGALLALGSALLRPRSRAELAFGVLAGSLACALVLQASVYGDTDNAQERYLVYALPLLFVAFGLYAERGWGRLRAHALLAASGAAILSLVPLAGLAAGDGGAHSLLLAAHRGLELELHDVGLVSLVFAAGATALSAVVLATAWKRTPAHATLVAFAGTAAMLLAVTAGAFSYYDVKRSFLRSTLLPTDASWVDHAHVGEPALLLTPFALRNEAHLTLFWNRSVDRVLLSEGARIPDAFPADRVVADRAGRLSAGGVPVRGPLVVDGYGSWVELRGAQRLGEAPTKTLWRPERVAQLRLQLAGRYYTGQLATSGAVSIWPENPGGRVSGWLELELTVPPDTTPTDVVLHHPAGRALEFRVRPETATPVRIPVCARGAWKAFFEAPAIGFFHGSPVGPKASEPRFREEPRAC